MATQNHYDVIIIGTGAGGGTLPTSWRPPESASCILERGDYVRREKENWSSEAVNVEGRYKTKEVWQDNDGNELHPHTNYWVGGNTKFYGAALFRLRREDFGEIRHHGGISPAWPISYGDSSRTTRQPSDSTRCMASAAKIPTDRSPARPILIRRSATSRGSSI